MASPFPFTSGQVLTAAQLNGIGDYTDYSASMTFTNFTLGNGTVAAYYAVVNDIVHYYGVVTLGSTSSVTGPIQVSLPVAASKSFPYEPGVVYLVESGVQNILGTCNVSGSNMDIRGVNVVSSLARSTSTSASFPFVWGTGDFFSFNIVYQKA
jgi:hypothetical protein